jgi:hypothetical protein
MTKEEHMDREASFDNTDLEALTERVKKVLDIRDRKYGFPSKTYPKCFVGSHAGDMISEITVAMQGGMGLGKLANVIHPYPTEVEAIRQCGDAYNRGRLTPTVKGIFSRLMAFKR